MYQLETTKSFEKDFKKLDDYTKKVLKAWIQKNLVGLDDPRKIGKSLKGNRSGQWRYRIGDYRLICVIDDDKLVIVALNFAHRKKIYLK